VPLLPQSDRNLAYIFLRFTLGITIFVHGVVRLPKIQEFAQGSSRSSQTLPFPLFWCGLSRWV
jgi:hypothetical protein